MSDSCKYNLLMLFNVMVLINYFNRQHFIVLPIFLVSNMVIGGSGEIRTHGAISDSTVFKTVGINRSPTLPCNWSGISGSN